MIDLDFLADDLKAVLRWQLANPGRTDGPDVPWAGLRVWGLFLRLHESRGGGGFGPAPITFADMEAFQRVSGEPLRPFEVEIIHALDREWMKAVNNRAEPGNTSAPVSSRPMSPALFDAVFQ